MPDFAMITAFGQDRPGIVVGLDEGPYRLGCNIEDTCVTRLRGEFSMMVMVRLPEGLSADRLSERLAPYVAPMGLTVLCRELPAQAAERIPAPEVPLFMLSVYGADHPGIVVQVARVVADHGGNITDRHTRVIGPEGQPVSVMILEIQLPQSSPPAELEQALERLKPALGVD